MNIKDARNAIEAILQSIPDSELPKFSKLEIEGDGQVCAWFGPSGWTLGSAKFNGVRDPIVYRDGALREAIKGETLYRADRRLLDLADNASEFVKTEITK